MKDIRSRVLQYYKNNTYTNIVDPSPDLKWKTKKAQSLGRKLLTNTSTVQSSMVPDVLKDKLGPLLSTAGWSKSLEGMPMFTAVHIEQYFTTITEKYSKKYTQVKKNFERASQLLAESYIDLDSIYCMDSDNLFCIKGVCAASLKKPTGGLLSPFRNPMAMLNSLIANVRQEKVVRVHIHLHC